MSKPHCYGAMTWILKYDKDKIPNSSICNCCYKNECLELTLNNVKDKVHELKILPEYFVAVLEGKKTFELRKNDRDYKVGDTLKLKEFDGEKYTQNVTYRTIAYIFKGGQYGLDNDYVILGIK